MYKINHKRTTSRFTEIELLDNIRTVWDFKGSQPTCGDMDSHPSIITMGTYFNRFGSWKEALKKFVLHQNDGVEIIHHIENKKSKRKSINNSIRYDIMKRDNFKCVICGDSPSINIDCFLEIDHINPLANGGDNSNKNLRTLCKKCNRGKLDKI